MELGSTCNYFQGFGEQAHSFGDLGRTAKNLKKSHLKGKAFISFDFFQQNSSASWGKNPHPLECIFFHASMLIWIGIGN